MTRPSPDRPATIYDVAKAAGVSHQTVSKVLRGLGGMRQETRERVEAEIRRLEYRPNASARALARARVKRIGIVGYETFQSSTSKVLSGVNEVLEDAGYILDLINIDPAGDVNSIVTSIEQLNATDVAGVLATSPTANVRAALEKVSFRMPVFLDVHGDPVPDDPSAPSRAARLILTHLTDLGHTDIAFLGGPAGWDSADARYSTYLSHLATRGLKPHEIGFGDWTAASGYDIVKQCSMTSEFTALFVANDRMALGAIRALHEAGISIPSEMSVGAIDDIPEAGYFWPPLSTVRVDFAASGRAAALNLLALIDGGDSVEYPASVLLPRDSTAPRA